MKKIYPILLGLLFVLSCSKKDRKRYSTWYIDGIEHTSNNVNSYVGNGESAVLCVDNLDRWDIRFYLIQHLPNTGTWPISSFSPNGNDPNYVYLNFYKGSTLYAVSPHNTTILTAQENNGKASYMLPPTWFIRMENNDPENPAPADSSFTYTTDSIQINGTFNQP